ncbi:FUSC family protein [Actinomycetospora sp. NBRC 106375]|uniref:FUSC family protein n=1 Tax=Actinomycetospora sp. NBRC 106375 TaxID=3032207 RepID=UPI0025550BED|nr:FUSC family protein [Actinomycetospora sp. NBRC 106375]
MAGRRGLRWLVRRDPGLVATRKAARVAVVATVAFMLCRYGAGSPTAATYAAFGAIGFGVLSQVVGTPRERTRTLAGCFVTGTVLLTIGTLLAGSTWAATAGMLVVGVVVAFLPIGGPRPAGVANGLQLLYILPSFPPFAPDTLPERVLGLALGMGLLALADRLLWPPRPVEPYACRAAGAARALADLLDAVTRDGATDLPARRAAAAHAVGRLKLQVTPWEERPTGPGARDRGLAHLGAALRSVQGRVEALLTAEERGAGAVPGDAVAALSTTAAALRRTSAALRGRGTLPDVALLDDARAAYTQRRITAIATIHGGDAAVEHARSAVAVAQVLAEARIAVAAARVVADPRGRAGVPADLGWWATAPVALLWRRRIRAHLSLRSVYLQNAVRLGVGLALARLVAGAFDLSHGLWVLLATLTLMRTSVTSTRATLLPAIAGTALGAVVAAGLLEVVGQDAVVYAVLFPVLCVASVLGGQLVGMIAGQAFFTVLVAVLFAQLAPAGPSLAGVRLLDVAVGAAVGIAVGAAVWPAGGHGEVRHDAARALHALADLLGATAAWLTGRGSRTDLARRLWVSDHQLIYFEADFLQYRAERRRRHEDDADWFTVLGVVHRTMRAVRSALDDTAAPAQREPAVPWPDLVDRLDHDARALATGYTAVAQALTLHRSPDVVLGVPVDFVDRALRAVADAPERREHPQATLRLVDAWGRLGWAADDLAALGVVLAPTPARVPRRRRQPA